MTGVMCNTAASVSSVVYNTCVGSETIIMASELSAVLLLAVHILQN